MMTTNTLPSYKELVVQVINHRQLNPLLFRYASLLFVENLRLLKINALSNPQAYSIDLSIPDDLNHYRLLHLAEKKNGFFRCHMISNRSSRRLENCL